MKVLNRGLALAVVGAGFAASPLSACKQQRQRMPNLRCSRSCATRRQGSVAVTKEAATGKAGFVRTNGDLMPGRSRRPTPPTRERQGRRLPRQVRRRPRRAHRRADQAAASTRARCGWTVTYTQSYKGVPVFGSGLKAHVDKQGDLTSVTGYAAPDLSLTITPAHQRRRRRQGRGRHRQGGPADPADAEAADTTGLRADEADLVVYRKGSVKGEAGDAVLA